MNTPAVHFDTGRSEIGANLRCLRSEVDVVGAHSRSAVGMAEPPFNIPVEIAGEVELAA